MFRKSELEKYRIREEYFQKDGEPRRYFVPEIYKLRPGGWGWYTINNYKVFQTFEEAQQAIDDHRAKKTIIHEVD